jgi:hypothetical protein
MGVSVWVSITIARLWISAVSGRPCCAQAETSSDPPAKQMKPMVLLTLLWLMAGCHVNSGCNLQIKILDKEEKLYIYWPPGQGIETQLRCSSEEKR